MLKILHVVSDDKFIDGQVGRYLTCENHIVYLKEELTYKGKFKDSIIWVKPLSNDYDLLINQSSKYDIIIIYVLGHEKADFINKLNPNAIIIWHFFGAEIYHNQKYIYNLYSTSTLRLLNIDNLKLHKLYISYINKKIKLLDWFKGKRKNNRSKIIIKAIKRVDYFLGFDINEYLLLKSKIKYLPPFLSLPLTIKVPQINLSENKNIKFIVGNSSSPSNNHADILTLLSGYHNKYPVLLPLNYGDSGDYNSKIKEIVKSLPFKTEILEDFIAFDDYVKMVGACSTAIFNSYRQMALGNILISIINGVKVYLSVKNPSLKWLTDLGFIVFSIEDQLEKDLTNNNLQLNLADCMHNRALYNKLNDNSNNVKFINNIRVIVNKHKVGTNNGIS